VHYTGDENVATTFPHRGSSHDKPFFRTCPSYLKKCEALVENSKANVVYKQEIASLKCDVANMPAMTPRNMKQLRNLRFKCLNQSRISRDALFNVHEIAYDVPGYV